MGQPRAVVLKWCSLEGPWVSSRRGSWRSLASHQLQLIQPPHLSVLDIGVPQKNLTWGKKGFTVKNIIETISPDLVHRKETLKKCQELAMAFPGKEA